ncbi:hypothetical protein MHU86_4719 [Fragilaria crotonensis]|nr:hypothetical protein MHU86_4719 [Fragilaria crotonensis]
MSCRGTLFLAVFFAVANGQGCSICGDGKSITAPDAIFAFPGVDPIGCGELQTAGRNGEISLENCPVLPALIAACACAPDSGTSPTRAPMGTASPALKPTRRPTLKPTTLVKPTTPGQCSICGGGKSVTAPDAIFEFPGFDPIACGRLQTAGRNGEIPLDGCAALPPLIDVCACAPDSGTSPTRAPMGTASPALKPTTPGQGCSICGDGKSVTAPDAIFAFPGVNPIGCGELQTAGLNGEILLESCLVLPAFIGACACAPDSGTSPAGAPIRTASSPALKPTRRPTQKLTASVPTRKPTRRPTQKPTARGPTRKPTRRPTQKPTARGPTRKPTRRPTQNTTARSPTRKPTRRPTLKPTL